MSPGRSLRRHWAAWLAAVYFVAMAIGVTFPGVVPANRIRPFILGIPFVFAWYIAWIAGALAVLLVLHLASDR